MTRIEKILRNARITLADPNQERFTDEDLLIILNEGVVDFCQQTQVLHEIADVPINVEDATLRLPDDVWLISRVSYDNRTLPLVTYKELDKITSYRVNNPSSLAIPGSRWEEDKGDPQAIIYDQREIGYARIYPIPNEFKNPLNYTFTDPGTTREPLVSFNSLNGVLVDGDSVLGEFNVNPYGLVEDSVELYGVLSNFAAPGLGILVSDGAAGVLVDDTSSTVDPQFGLVVDAVDAPPGQDFIEPLYGVVGGAVAYQDYVRVSYVQNPTELEDVNSTLQTPQMYDIALKFYVVGQAFLNDLDTRYQAKGGAQMQIYERHVRNAKRSNMRQFTQAGQFETTYRRAV